jgi:hypothetical protein
MMKKVSIKKKESMCPSMKNLFEGCYFMELNSRTIGLAVYYCSKHFDECEIYKNLAVNQPTDSKKLSP